MKFINLTPHCVRLTDGREFAPAITPARVIFDYTPFKNSIAEIQSYEIFGLPPPEEGVIYITSGIMATHVNRMDVVAPAAGHHHRIIGGKGVWAVPGFVRY